MSEVLKIYVLNGPNLNLLGEREPDIYGNLCLEDIDKMLKEYAEKNNATIHFKQSNHEGELIDFIHEASKKAEAIIINPAGYTHTSVALLDALLASKIPISSPYSKLTVSLKINRVELPVFSNDIL